MADQTTQQDLKEFVYIPGAWRCPQCSFELLQSTLSPDGNVYARDEPARCTNGCGPMWRVTYKDRMREVFQAYEVAMADNRALTAERDEADRRAGAAERENARFVEEGIRSNHHKDKWRERLGYHRNTSFDYVTEDLASFHARAVETMTKAVAELKAGSLTPEHAVAMEELLKDPLPHQHSPGTVLDWPTLVLTEALREMLAKAVVFSDWAAGEGLAPNDPERPDVESPEDFLFAFGAVTGIEDYDKITDLIKRLKVT